MGSSENCGARAKIVLRYPNNETARAVASAISPDNFQAPKGINIIVEINDEVVSTSITCVRVGSLIATIDDILSCVGAAEKALNAVNEQ